MDAAQRSIETRGLHASTMTVIARDAGYSRSRVYRLFPTRQQLIDALVQRAVTRHARAIIEHLPPESSPVAQVVESLVIVATGTVADPLLTAIAAESDDGFMTTLLAANTVLTEMLERRIDNAAATGGATSFRAGLRSADLSRYIIVTAITLMQRLVPETSSADGARRYIETFVLPAVVERPPVPQSVFDVPGGAPVTGVTSASAGAPDCIA